MSFKKNEYKNHNTPFKKIISLTCAFVLLISLLSFTALAAPSNNTTTNSVIAQPAANKISQSLSAQMNVIKPNEKIPIIVVLNDQSNLFTTTAGRAKMDVQQTKVKNILKAAKTNGKAGDIKTLYIINGVAVTATSDVINSIAILSEVSKIYYDEKVSIPKPNPSKPPTTQATNTWGVEKINAPAVWAKGNNGLGITVGVVDTGVDATHPDLKYLPGTTTAKVTKFVDYVNGQTTAYDDNGHGTHVSGTISGTGVGTYQTGVAPGTSLIVSKVLDAGGSGTFSNLALGFQWCTLNGAKIVSCSIGGGHNDPMTTAVNNMVAAGVVPVIASGNNGVYGASSVTCPGDEANAVTIGATDSNDVIAYFSGRGPSLVGGIKPDVCAPGVGVTSTIPGGGYDTWDGTSMATPHVSGTVALMLKNTPTLSVATIKQTLQDTAVHLGTPGKNNDYGSGRIDAYKAVYNLTPPPIGDITKLAYITNLNSNNVSVFNITTNTVTGSVQNVPNPFGVAVSPGGTSVYVTDRFGTTINKIDASTRTVTKINVGNYPIAVALNPTGSKAYVSNYASNTVSVIDTTTNAVTGTITVGVSPVGVAVSPTGTKVVVANNGGTTVSVIDTATNAVSSVTVGTAPFGVAFNPSGTKAYVTNSGSKSVSVIDMATNTVTGTITVGNNPTGIAIMPSGGKGYVTNYNDGNVAVINVATSTVQSTISLGVSTGKVNAGASPTGEIGVQVAAGYQPEGVSITADGREALVSNAGSNSVTIIDTATDTLKSTVKVGIGVRPYSLGQFTVPGSSTPPPTASTINGYSFTDTNGNSIMDVGEQSLNNIVITLTGYDTSKGQLVSKTTSTSSTGYYTFTGVNQGTYVVSQSFLLGWLPTSDAAYTINIPSTSTTIRKDFSNTKYP